METEERVVNISLEITERFESFFKDSGNGVRDEVYLRMEAQRKGCGYVCLDTRIKVKSEDDYGPAYAHDKMNRLEGMFARVYRIFEQEDAKKEMKP